MRALPLALLPAVLAAAPAAPAAKSAFPYPIHSRTLANGLRIVVVPTGVPGLVALQIPVSTGSRNEVEPGKSGFAHFFEHMMFRGTATVKPADWNLTLQKTGADQNAFTSDDLTNYHTTCGKEDLETWLRLEADRFQHLSYPEAEFKDESRAVLGEYNKNSSNPLGKLFEAQREAAYKVHTYRHTTMGFLKDIEDMPNQYKYSLEFFRRWYRPDNVTIVLAGDVEPASAFALVEKHFGAWKRVPYKAPAVPQEPPRTAPASVHVAWETPTLPYVTVAFHAPTKFSTTDNGALALDLAGELLFGRQSEIYQRLVLKEQKVDQFFAMGGDSKDPSLFTVIARVRKGEDMAYVRDAILDACARGAALPFSASRLEEAKTEQRLGFARSLDSAEGVAGIVARAVCYDRDPQALVKQLALQEAVQPSDLSRVAKETFRDANRVIATLCKGPLPEAMNAPFEGVEARAARLAQLPALPLLERPSASPVVNLDLVFRTGSVDDPAGKEGLAQLAAAMLTQAGTATRTFAETTKAAGAAGGGLGARVDKEFTSFVLTAPRLKAAEALELALEHLAAPGFREEDFQRLKTQALNALKVQLKANNDEELGKLALEGRIYGEPFAHPVLGTERGIQAITLDDVKAFVRTAYTRGRLQAGIGGAFGPAEKAQVLRALASLPEGGAPRAALPAPEAPKASRVRIVAKETRATAISFGFPIAVDRRSPDFPALWVATSWLGEHRNSTAHLYQRLREVRGLNYGDYAYIEAFPMGMFATRRSPGFLRSLNHFQVWIRPVAPANGAFALKGALYELGKLVNEGMSEAAFQASRTYLEKSLDHQVSTGAERLGNDLDMQLLGLDKGFVAELRPRLKALTRQQVNEALKRHFRTDRLDIAVVTKDAEAFKRDLLAEACPVPAYQTPKPELKAEDEAIRRLKLDLRAEDITVTPLDELFN